MSSINPTSWRFYVGSFVSNETAGLADTRNLQALQAATMAACTAGPTFDPARCSALAQTLGRVTTHQACYSGAPTLMGSNPATWGPATPAPVATSTAAMGGILAATNAVAANVPNAALAALNAPLSNTVCTA
jgi:hypothetical protein